MHHTQKQHTKKKKWRKLKIVIERSAVEERVVLGADLHGFVAVGDAGIERIHGSHGYENIYDDGE